MKKIILLFFILITCSAQNLFACHPIALLNSQVEYGPGFIRVTADSDPATCGCTTYYMDIEVVKISDSFTGTGFTLPGYSNYQYLTGPQFYTTTEMVKPNCVLQTYPWTTINYSDLCGGTTYKYRMREHHNSEIGPWTQEYTFTTPGISSTEIELSASNLSVCYPATVTLSALITSSCGAQGVYSWSTGEGNLNQITVTPEITTSYIVNYITASDTVSDTVTVNVTGPNGILSGPSTACNNNPVTITANGFTGTPQWLVSVDGVNWNPVSGSGTTNTFTLLQSSYIKVTNSSGSGQCSDDSDVMLIYQMNTPELVLSSPPSICNNVSANLIVTGADTYSWSPSTGLNSTSSSNVSASPQQSTTYTVVGQNACGSDTAYTFLEVNPGPVSIEPVIPQCTDGDVIALTGNPSGGIFSGPGVSGNSFNPQTAGTGIHSIIYSVTDNNCYDTVSISIEVNVCTGITANKVTGIKLFPNPVHNGESIQFNDVTLSDVMIYSIDGRFVSQPRIQNNEVFIDLSAGYYILSAFTGESRSYFRMEVLE